MNKSLSETERRKLTLQFGEQVRRDCDKSESLGYSPRQFRLMIGNHGPVGACIRVIMTTKIPDGFLKLLELKRLDLAAEATILRSPWHKLFEGGRARPGTKAVAAIRPFRTWQSKLDKAARHSECEACAKHRIERPLPKLPSSNPTVPEFVADGAI